ncbi:MAG: double-strand break repair protein AddB [Alphaproteobacteria bacterium]|nr:double-strand break repair protein AddB [Alphaproteobacteria bacterium]
MGCVKNVFTIEPHVPFPDTLAAELWRRNDGDGFRLSQTLVLLPTRRACRNLGESFARIAKGKPVLLPDMRPLGDVDEDEITFAEEGSFDLPPAIAPLKRLMLLTQQVQMRDPSLSCDQAAQGAIALARFLDQVQIEQCDLEKLPTLVQNRELAEHWQQTLRFLEIVTAHWPSILAGHGLIDPAERRNSAMKAQADVWRKNPPTRAIIAAGSTGSVPATAELLNVIAGLPQGAVVLPGLDRAMEEDAWQKISDAHPQHAMKKLLDKMKVARRDVQDWGAAREPSPRARLINETMRPADLTEAWRELRGTLDPAGVRGLTRLTLDHPQEEAQVIALRLRAALETPDATAALVTADRGLAQRVASLLRRWDIEIDDSGGAPLSSQLQGAFLNLVLAAAAPHAGAVDLLALLKHPFAACGQHPAACRAFAREAEIRVRKGQAENFAALKKLLRPLTDAWRDHVPLAQRLALHIEVAEAVAASDAESGAQRLWRGDKGADAAAWLDEWRESANEFPPLDGGDYKALFGALASAKTMRTRRAAHPRLSILGPLEARLLSADIVILGGMNEGAWPPDAGFDPWMSRPMRADFGLPAPEFRIGLSAHDFAQLACAKDVMLTRSARDGGAPTVPSRFLLQIDAVLRAAGLSDDKHDALAPAEPWRAWAQMLDRPEHIEACDRPRPCPPIAARPRALSVTEIGTWLRNPYAIYAKHVLGLRKLDELDAELDASDRGTMIHEALEKFIDTYRGTLPDDAENKLLEIGRGVFAQAHDDPRVQAFWWARFADIAAWFVAQERAHRAAGGAPFAPESEGRIVIDGFTLKGRADRIDRMADGSLRIVDYKTGSTPTRPQVASGIEPQLPLLALIAERGGFKDVDAACGALEYWSLKGGRGGCKVTRFDEEIAALTEQAERGLKGLIAAFADPATVYEAAPRPRLQPKYDDYAHLARFQEWGRIAAEGDE